MGCLGRCPMRRASGFTRRRDLTVTGCIEARKYGGVCKADPPTARGLRAPLLFRRTCSCDTNQIFSAHTAAPLYGLSLSGVAVPLWCDPNKESRQMEWRSQKLEIVAASKFNAGCKESITGASATRSTLICSSLTIVAPIFRRKAKVSNCGNPGGRWRLRTSDPSSVNAVLYP